MNEAPNRNQHKIAKAEFEGMCEAVYALGLPNVGTPFALTVIVSEAFDFAGERPVFAPFNREQQSYDLEVANYVIRHLQWDILIPDND